QRGLRNPGRPQRRPQTRASLRPTTHAACLARHVFGWRDGGVQEPVTPATRPFRFEGTTTPRRAERLLAWPGGQLLEEPLERHVMLVVPKTVAPERQWMTLHPTLQGDRAR